MLKLKGEFNVKYGIALLGYIAILHFLMLTQYETTFKTSNGGYLFVYDFVLVNYVLCLIETAIMFVATIKKFDTERLTEKTMLILLVLYFIPGVVQQAVTGAPIAYMLYYFAFWVGMEAWIVIIRPRTTSIAPGEKEPFDIEPLMEKISIVAFAVIMFVAFYTGTMFTPGNFAATLSDIYGVRAEFKESMMHWTIVAAEYWASYFLIVAVAYFAKKRNWLFLLIALFAEGNVFLIQANRITLFFTGLALIFGLVRFNNRRIAAALLLLGAVLAVEVLFINPRGWMVTDIFRRFSIVPNSMGDKYFDYFQTHVPDYLRFKYKRLAVLLGSVSPYESPTIGQIIGMEYFHSGSNANTGLVGGAMFAFGYLGPVITSFGYIMSYRLFEMFTGKLRDPEIMLGLALILSTLSINMGSLLANIFSLSYMLMLLLTFMLISFECGLTESRARMTARIKGMI
jgi:hypothetical protein